MIEAFTGEKVESAAERLYNSHRMLRRAIWNTDPGRRSDAWRFVNAWGPPLTQDALYDTFDRLHKELIDEVKKDLNIAITG